MGIERTWQKGQTGRRMPSSSGPRRGGKTWLGSAIAWRIWDRRIQGLHQPELSVEPHE